MKRSANSLRVRFAGFMGLYFGMILCALAADGVGTVMNLDGTLTAKTPDGSLKALAVKSVISPGDTLITGRDSYARIKFPDGAEFSLNPKTQFKVEDYHYNVQQPEKDSAGFNLLKGGLRAISGLIGHRGNPDSYRVKTQAATAGIRGTQYGLLICQNDCDDIKTPDGKTPENGLHAEVTKGAVIINNAAGSQLLNPGQFVYVKDAQIAPLLIPPAQAGRVDVPPHIAEAWAKSRAEEKKSAPADGKKEDPKDLVKNVSGATQCLAH